MRFKETRSGIAIKDAEGNELGVSKKAGVKAVNLTALTRVMNQYARELGVLKEKDEKEMAIPDIVWDTLKENDEKIFKGYGFFFIREK